MTLDPHGKKGGASVITLLESVAPVGLLCSIPQTKISTATLTIFAAGGDTPGGKLLHLLWIKRQRMHVASSATLCDSTSP